MRVRPLSPSSISWIAPVTRLPLTVIAAFDAADFGRIWKLIRATDGACTASSTAVASALPEAVASAIESGDLVAAGVLSGNRNFEGRIHANVRANYLASPPLVVAYALAGSVDFDFETQPLGKGKNGKDVYLRDIWPSRDQVTKVTEGSIKPEMFKATYDNILKGSKMW